MATDYSVHEFNINTRYGYVATARVVASAGVIVADVTYPATDANEPWRLVITSAYPMAAASVNGGGFVTLERGVGAADALERFLDHPACQIWRWFAALQEVSV